jgi:hypothetical protein
MLWALDSRLEPKRVAESGRTVQQPPEGEVATEGGIG